MPRLPKKVGVYEHRNSGTKVDIRLDSKTGEFSAVIAGANFTGKDMEALKRKLGEFLDKATQIAWAPVIHYNVGPNYSSAQDEIDISLSRFYAAAGPDGRALQAAWESNGKATLSDSKSGNVIPAGLPFYPGRARRNQDTAPTEGYYLYTDELWAALAGLVATCTQIRNLAVAAVVDKDRIRLLTEFSGLLASQWPNYMPEPKKDNSDDDDD